jgi:hypothetical protein
VAAGFGRDSASRNNGNGPNPLAAPSAPKSDSSPWRKVDPHRPGLAASFLTRLCVGGTGASAVHEEAEGDPLGDSHDWNPSERGTMSGTGHVARAPAETPTAARCASARDTLGPRRTEFKCRARLSRLPTEEEDLALPTLTDTLTERVDKLVRPPQPLAWGHPQLSSTPKSMAIRELGARIEALEDAMRAIALEVQKLSEHQA